MTRRTKTLLAAAELVACVAAFAAYLYSHHLDVVRYSTAQGRATAEQADLAG